MTEYNLALLFVCLQVCIHHRGYSIVNLSALLMLIVESLTLVLSIE